MKNKKILILIIPVVLLIALFLMPNPSEKEIVYSNYEPTELIKVYVFGEVKEPGYYYLSKDSTTLDLINKCGLTDYSNESAINLEQKLSNGKSYEVSMIEDNEKNVSVDVSPSPIIPSIDADNGLININTAPASELITLSGIGTVKAQAIINYRKLNEFKEISDLMKVEGISETIYNAIKNYITV